MIINLFIASLPAFVFIILFSLIDKKMIKKKWLILLGVLIVGAIGSYICYRFEMHFGSYFKKVKDSNYFEVLFYAIFGVAIFEEGYKWLVTTIASFLDKKKSKYSILIYSVFASIGFAWFENIAFYAFKYDTYSLFGRMFTAFPNHICNAIFMGCFLTMFNNEKSNKRWLYFIFSLIIPILTHAIYNSFLYQGNPKLMIYYYIYVFILYIGTSLISIKMLKELRKN